MKTTVTLSYLSKAEGLLDMSGFTKNPELINQRQPNPQNWGLKTKVLKATLKKPEATAAHFRLELDLDVEGPKKRISEWLAEHTRINATTLGLHISKDTALNAARKTAKNKQKKSRAENASKKAGS